MQTSEKSNETHSIFDNAVGCMVNTNNQHLPSSANALQAKGTCGSIHSSSRSSPTSSVSGCSAVGAYSRGQAENVNYKGKIKKVSDHIVHILAKFCGICGPAILFRFNN